MTGGILGGTTDFSISKFYLIGFVIDTGLWNGLLGNFSSIKCSSNYLLWSIH